MLNDDAALEGYRTAPNITRILEHEVGHGIGLGHTDAGQDNIMYPACCPAGMPVPPAIGPDDLAGLRVHLSGPGRPGLHIHARRSASGRCGPSVAGASHDA